jgi:selenocysteine lyase/cysteine desulfurase
MSPMDARQNSRRDFLRSTLAASVAAATTTLVPASAAEWSAHNQRIKDAVGQAFPGRPGGPDDEDGWGAIANLYEVTSRFTNLENGYWGIMSRPVLDQYKELTDFINRENTTFARLELGDTYRHLRESVATFLGVQREEVALTRGATEALQALIGSYNGLRPGDTVLYADLDYSEMKNAMRWLEQRRGAVPIKVNFPEATADRQLTQGDILAFYEAALNANPGTRLLLLTHLNNLTGMIIPVAQIAAMAKSRGIDVILDAAHSVGQVDFNISDLGCDFVGVNLHKWVGAPIGCGVIYIRKGRSQKIDTYMGKDPGSPDITARIDTGTSNFAAHMAIPAAIEFHNLVGTQAKESRLRYLRNIWVERARRVKGLTVLPPDDPKMVAALTSFRLNGATSAEDNLNLMTALAEDYGILTTRRTGLAAGDCIRVTPAIYNSSADVMKLAHALEQMAS